MQVFQRVLDKWAILAQELGNWCADQYLIDAFLEKRYRKYELKVERRILGEFRV